VTRQPYVGPGLLQELIPWFTVSPTSVYDAARLDKQAGWKAVTQTQGMRVKTEPGYRPIFSLHLDPEDGGRMSLRTVGVHLQDFMVPQYETA
jgi:hypothetical protein